APLAAARSPRSLKTGDRPLGARAATRGLSPVVAQLLQSQPEAVRRYVWEPLCVSALNTPVAEADARVFANVLRDALFRAREDSDLLVPTRDLSAILPDAAIDWLGERGAEIWLGVRVSAVRPEAAGWHVAIADKARNF